MGRFIIEGGYPLNGTLRVQGAKNAALPILAAAIMSEGEITLTNWTICWRYWASWAQEWSVRTIR